MKSDVDFIFLFLLTIYITSILSLSVFHCVFLTFARSKLLIRYIDSQSSQPTFGQCSLHVSVCVWMHSKTSQYFPSAWRCFHILFCTIRLLNAWFIAWTGLNLVRHLKSILTKQNMVRPILSFIACLYNSPYSITFSVCQRHYHSDSSFFPFQAIVYFIVIFLVLFFYRCRTIYYIADAPIL